MIVKSNHGVTRAGQSMVEMIIAIAVIVMILAGLLTATTSSLSRSTDVSQRSQATKRAQNGIELARQLRDEDWNEFKAISGTKYVVDGQLVDSAPSGDMFIQTLEFDHSCGPNCVIVTSTVSWQEKGVLKDISVQTTLTQWK